MERVDRECVERGDREVDRHLVERDLESALGDLLLWERFRDPRSLSRDLAFGSFIAA